MIGLLHTAEVHVDRFEALLPGQDVTHVVRPDLLARAQSEGLSAVAGDFAALLDDMADRHEQVLCTCSTLGPLADQAGVLRIDRPAMEAAAAVKGDILVVICLESTREATLALFDEIAGPGRARLVLCAAAWPYFEAGDMAEFYARIAQTVMAEADGCAAVLLAQASMAGAAPLLSGLGVPVFTTPRLAADRLIEAQNG